MLPANRSSSDERGPAEIINDLWLLCRDYAKQETIDPLKSIGRFLGWGLAGSLLVALGVLFGAVAVMRALQTEIDTFDGNLNWVPYVVALLFTVAAAGLAVMAIKRPIRAEEKQR